MKVQYNETIGDINFSLEIEYDADSANEASEARKWLTLAREVPESTCSFYDGAKITTGTIKLTKMPDFTKTSGGGTLV